MQELISLVEELRSELKLKEDRLKANDVDGMSLISNRKREIDNFEESMRHIDRNPFSKNEILKNFRKTAEDIRNRIGEIE